jgi:hypothetical protein
MSCALCLQDVLKLLRSDFEKEVGPYKLRKSAQLYESWVEQAGGVIKGSTKGAGAKDISDPSASGSSVSSGSLMDTMDEEDSEDTVVPLWLLKQSNDEQVAKLFKLLHKLPACVHWLLEQVVFPSFMQHQALKLSASGQELGGSTLFHTRRIGFSGTPSDLLPLDLGSCGYEEGSDGKMVHVLTNDEVVNVQFAPADWTVDSLIQMIASSEPRYNALIDTGALITGLSNEGVAKKLLSFPSMARWCEGVVFLDESDEKVILVRATGRVLKLSQCGISVENRFAFYDQIHTTGMDSASAGLDLAAAGLSSRLVPSPLPSRCRC